MLITAMSTAPSGVPRNIIANSTSPYDVMLSWQPPYLVERNGVIVNYTILLGESPDSEHRTFSSQEPRVSLHSLASRTTYLYSIAAGTIAGTGPFSDFQQVTTLEEGKEPITCLLLHAANAIQDIMNMSVVCPMV